MVLIDPQGQHDSKTDEWLKEQTVEEIEHQLLDNRIDFAI
jgi:hypothetical protein